MIDITILYIFHPRHTQQPPSFGRFLNAIVANDDHHVITHNDPIQNDRIHNHYHRHYWDQ